MSWLNWSLNLHIRLRTISFLIPTHITHVYVQECHIHLCNCTWLNVFHILNFCWSNTKIFLSILVIFGKSFVFAKITKNFKNNVALFWRLGRGSSQSHAWVASLHRRFSWLTGESMSQSQKRLKFFFLSKFWVFKSSRNLVWRLYHEGKLQKFSWLTSRPSHGWTF